MIQAIGMEDVRRVMQQKGEYRYRYSTSSHFLQPDHSIAKKCPSTLFYSSTYRGHFDAVETILYSTMPLKIPTRLNSRCFCDQSMTALLDTTESNRVSIMDLLLVKNRMDYFIHYHRRCMALRIAVTERHICFVQSMLNNISGDNDESWFSAFGNSETITAR